MSQAQIVLSHCYIYFDAKVFNPNAQTYRRSSLETNYIQMRGKRWSECTIEEFKESSKLNMVHLPHSSLQLVEWASLPPAGMATFYKRLASMLSKKQASTYFSTLGWIDQNTPLLLTILRSVLCIWGARDQSACTYVVKGCDSIDLHGDGRGSHPTMNQLITYYACMTLFSDNCIMHFLIIIIILCGMLRGCYQRLHCAYIVYIPDVSTCTLPCDVCSVQVFVIL